VSAHGDRAVKIKATPIKFKMRPCQDVPRWLKKFDAVQKRTAKSKLQLP